MIKKNNIKHQLISQMGEETPKKDWSTIKAILMTVLTIIIPTIGFYYLGMADPLDGLPTDSPTTEDYWINGGMTFATLIMTLAAITIILAIPYSIFTFFKEQIFNN